MRVGRQPRADREPGRSVLDRRGWQTEQHAVWEFSPCLYRRCLPPGLQPGHAGREEGERRRFPEGGPCLVREPRRRGRQGDDRQPAPEPTPSATPARTSASGTRDQALAQDRQREKPSGSSRRRCANGPMPRPIPPPITAPPSCPPGCTGTTGIARTAAYNPEPPSPRLGLTEHNLLRLHSERVATGPLQPSPSTRNRMPRSTTVGSACDAEGHRTRVPPIRSNGGPGSRPRRATAQSSLAPWYVMKRTARSRAAL